MAMKTFLGKRSVKEDILNFDAHRILTTPGDNPDCCRLAWVYCVKQQANAWQWSYVQQPQAGGGVCCAAPCPWRLHARICQCPPEQPDVQK